MPQGNISIFYDFTINTTVIINLGPIILVLPKNSTISYKS